MEDDRERIFASIRRGIRGIEKFTAARSNRSPMKSTISHDFQSLFDAFSSELRSLGGDAVALEREADILEFVLEKTGSTDNVFVYDGISRDYGTTVRKIGEQRAIKISTEFDGSRHSASLFDAAISSCAACIAETGTVVIENSPRLPAALAPKLFVFADPGKLIPSLDDFFAAEYRDFVGSNLFLITGPSRTADIEKELVTGVHGPKEVYIIFLQH